MALSSAALAAPALPALAQDREPATGGALFSAQQEAVTEHHAVPVDALTTQTTTVKANPDGSFTSTTALQPVRVRKDGGWVPVDATLTRNADGSWSPEATPHAVALSGGGTGPAVRLTHEDGSKLALTMPFALPTPEVSGDTALYRSVLPGVDLSLSVTEQGGFSDVLIVHDKAAAADPRIKELRLGATTDGLRLTATPAGGLEAKTADGTLDYVSPRPVMWDSAAPEAGTPGAGPAGTAPVAAGATAVRVTSLADNADEAPASSAEGPGPGAQVDQVPMTTTPTAVTLRPDTSVLSDPDTVYPVYIDPYTNPVSSTSGHYTEVYSSSSCSNSPQYDKPQSNGEGVGYQRWGGACGTGMERSFYGINTSGLSPQMVISNALVTVNSTYAASWDCSKDQPITLHTTGTINSGTTWNNQPGTNDNLGYPAVRTTIPSAANSNSSCSNHTASFTVTNQAQKIAAAGIQVWTVGLFGDETNSSGNDNYLRVSTVVYMTTTFDIPPKPPGNLYTTPSAVGAAANCTDTGPGWVGATSYGAAGSNLQLHSTVTTEISGELAQAVYEFWDRSQLTNGNPTTVASPASSYVASGTDAAVPVGIALKDGHEYGWDAYAKTNSAAHLSSPVSDHCWFRTDFTAPDVPQIADNASFPPVGGGAGSPVVYAGPGRTTDFTVSSTENAPAATCTPGPCLASGMDHFVWRLDAQPTAQAGTSVPLTGTDANGVAGGKITVPVTQWGVHTLYVAAVDKAGNLSKSPASYTYAVPWNPDTKITPGDVGGDGIPDLLATTRTGDLVLLPGNTDAAQPVAPVQPPTSQTTTPATGPVTVSTAAQSPDGSGWNNYLIAHRGNTHGADVDDLFAYNKTSKQLYIVKNDLDSGSVWPAPPAPYSTYGGFTGKRFDVVVKDACEDSNRVADAARCRTAGYDATTWNVDQLITPGNLYGNTNNYPAVITVENKKLWIYQTDGGGHFKHPLLLGDGDWSGYTLMGPGTVGGTLTKDANGKGSVTGGSAVIWARDDISGSVTSFPVSVEPTTLVPSLLHAPVRTALTSTVTTTDGQKLCLDVDHANPANGTRVQVWWCNQTNAQSWTMMADGSIRAMGGCLDVNGNGSANGTIVQLWNCNGGGSQKWVLSAGGGLMNPNSGKCLDDPNASQTPGTQLIIYTCNQTNAQGWTGGAAAGWTANPPTALTPVLTADAYPAVMSPGDLNSPAGGPDGNPELYAVDTANQLVEYPGTTSQGATAAFAAPVSLGSVGSTATHAWRIDEGAGTSVADSLGNQPATLNGAYTWATDATRGKVLQLGATTGYAATAGPAVDTTGSFSVSAWVKLGSTTANSTFVSQQDTDGNASAFQMYYSSGSKTWAFGTRHGDPTTSVWSAAYATSPAVVGKWTHLVGVYDTGTSQMLLYVDGKLSASREYTGASWNANGGVQIGRKITKGVYGEYANGSVSDVRIYPSALSPATAATMGELPGISQLD